MKGNASEVDSKLLVAELERRSVDCHALVKKTLRAARIEYRPLRNAMEHYFSYWNDFSHPGLFSLAVEAAGGKPDQLVEPQAAFAMIAAALDLHDDIVDKSEQKARHSTVYGKFGGELTLLLGNAFLISGMTVLNSSLRNLNESSVTDALDEVRNSLFEVGNAHALELGMKQRIDISPKKCMEVIRMKAASIEANVLVAGFAASGKSKILQVLRKYGRVLGTLATLREEFIDIFEFEELCRRVKDEVLPVPIVFALDEEALRPRILKLLRGRLTETRQAELLNTVLNSKPVTRLKHCMAEQMEEAVSFISRIGTNNSKKWLGSIACSMLENL